MVPEKRRGGKKKGKGGHGGGKGRATWEGDGG